MTSLPTPRMGAAILRVTAAYYAPFFVGHYRGYRDSWLIDAKHSTDEDQRARNIRYAISAHRSMMRCLRECRRTEAADVGRV